MTYEIQFYVRASKARKNGYAPLEMSVNINGARKFVSLPYKCLPSDFNRKRQPNELLDYMAGMRRRVNELLAGMVTDGTPLTTSTLVDYIKTGGFKPFTIENLFDEYFSILQKRIGKTITKGVYEKYILARDLFYTVVKKDAECTTISPSHIQQFKAICESKYKQSTVAGYLRKIKTVMIFALDNARMKTNPFTGIKIIKGQKDVEFLTEGELTYLENLSPENKSLQNALNCFLFECYSGISFCDIAKLHPEDIQEKDGVFFIQGTRQKTGKTFTSVLMPNFTRLVDIENGKIKGFKFHVRSLQKINAYLHTVEALYGLNKPLTTHLGRHTYATLLANKYKCRMEVVADALGDSLKVTVKHYAKFLSETTVNEIGNSFRRVV